MNHPDWKLLAEKAALYLYPRRCPFCGAVLGRDAVQGTVCPACFEAADKRLVHLPPRLPETEHAFYALNSAVAAYYYSGEVRHAILACKRGGELWRARELADRMAVLIWGAMPSHTPAAARQLWLRWECPVTTTLCRSRRGSRCPAPPVCRFCWPGGWAY